MNKRDEAQLVWNAIATSFAAETYNVPDHIRDAFEEFANEVTNGHASRHVVNATIAAYMAGLSRGRTLGALQAGAHEDDGYPD